MGRCGVLVFVTLLFSTACVSSRACSKNSSIVNSDTAAYFVQRALTIDVPVTAKELHGGLSSAKLFLVTAGSKAYVLRASAPSTSLESREIACLQIASDTGYGPHVYFIDPDRRYIIMEYVVPHPIDKEDRTSKRYYRVLGKTVSKIHNGPNFPECESIFTGIERDIEQLKNYHTLCNLVTRMEKMFFLIRTALTPVSTKAPCHNDLNPNNIIYTGSTFKIIDYEAARQDDPYYDLATIIQFNCLNDECEKELLNAYLGRPMTPEERARLYLMKQAVRIAYSAGLILALTSSDQAEEIDVGIETYNEYMLKSETEGFDLHRLAFHLLNLANTSFESAEFQQSMDILTTKAQKVTLQPS